VRRQPTHPAPVATVVLGLFLLLVTACSGGSNSSAQQTSSISGSSTGASGASGPSSPGPGAVPPGPTTSQAVPPNPAITIPPPPPATAPTGEPTLGVAYLPSTRGFGEVKPANVFLGGDPTGLFSNLTWQSWDGSQAMGTGTGLLVPEGKMVVDAVSAPVVIVAFNLGQCDGHPAYQAVEWYFPDQGGKFDPNSYTNACTGDVIGSR
jgi:hypothetical protein